MPAPSLAPDALDSVLGREPLAAESASSVAGPALAGDALGALLGDPGLTRVESLKAKPTPSTKESSAKPNKVLQRLLEQKP